MTGRSRRTRTSTKVAEQTTTTSLEGETPNPTQSDLAIHVKKKTKTSGSEPRVGVAAAKLCTFKDMPLDVLYEICYFLHASDLVSLCDASPLFLRTLCRQSVNHIWSKSREAEGVYEIPDGVNEYYWAKLLFSTRCMECNVDDVFNADFKLRRRVCDFCRQANTIDIERFKKHFGADTTILNFVPSTMHDRARNLVYWKDDIVQQMKTLSALNQDVNCGRDGAYHARERYKATRSRFLRFIDADAAFFNKWQKERAEIFLRQRYEEVTKRFVGLGYSLEDVSIQIRAHKLLNKPVMLTEKCWRHILNEFEPTIKAASEARASELRNALTLDRRNLLDKVYAVHRFNQVAPSQWRSLPQVQSLLKMQHFNDLIECDNNHKLTEEDFTPLMKMIEELVKTAYEEAKIRLREQVLADNNSSFSKRVSSRNRFKGLELATVVFSCQRCKLFYFGWDDMRSHPCGDKGLGYSTGRTFGVGHMVLNTTLEDLSGEFPHTFEFCAEGGAAVSLILKVLGLDPNDATPSQLDASDSRFLCGNLNHKEKGCKPHTAFDWRSFASHLLTCHLREIEQNKMPPPSLMTAASTCPSLQDVRKGEADIALEYGQWACAHCTKNLNAGCLVNIEIVRKHVHATHKVPHIQEGTDLIDMSGYRLRRALACGVYIDYKAKWYGSGY
ncbi:hypothetical protein D9619_009367 [Psilocybe cf. subviscida]|uniref:F-box domain-containing protein n=1 Tax=Psilocybe cf. subviscida TaxID=2480587 RepID=A0A8H5FA98_9AGAR|nr:hypothetical protein D9619_009367 [Psilocybe cf. subviscida]